MSLSLLESRADQAACDALLRTGSKSFFVASLLLPARVRNPALPLYAFCRIADDAVDLTQDERRLDSLRDRLDRIYAGRPDNHPVDRAFTGVVAGYNIPRAMPELLLEGFEWDLRGRRYADSAALEQYAARVAGSVGTMMACLMQTRTPEAMARANELGIAMQLTNIARDVGEDARAGRLYLPLDGLVEAGIDPADWLREPVFSPQLAPVIERLLTRADDLYKQAEQGIALLPQDCRVGILAAARLYAAIGERLRAHGHNSVSTRTVVPRWQKAAILARIVLGTHTPQVDQKAEWLLGLFERLERRDRQALEETL